MSKRPKDNSVGPWAKEKLDSLRRGLDYYTTRLKNTPYWKKVYVDAFAGPGLSKVRTESSEPRPVSAPAQDDLFLGLPVEEDPVEQEVKYLNGSPRVALDLANPFDSYVFIEKDPKRRTELEALKREYKAIREIEVLPGDANEELLGLLRRGISTRSHRVYVFLDPFGVQVPWTTMQALAATGAVEVMINFPLGMAIRRMLPRRGVVPEGWGVSLDAFFGSGDWREHSYTGEIDLAGDPIKREDSEPRLLAWYRGRLKDTFGFVSEAQLITNTRGTHLYFLVWAGPRQEGLKGANYIMTMKARGGPKRKAG